MQASAEGFHFGVQMMADFFQETAGISHTGIPAVLMECQCKTAFTEEMPLGRMLCMFLLRVAPGSGSTRYDHQRYNTYGLNKHVNS